MAKLSRSLTLAEKVEILKEIDEGVYSKTQIAKRHEVPKSTLSRFIKNKEKLFAAHENCDFAPKRKRMRTAAHPGLEQALLLWLKRARSSNIPVNGPTLRVKVGEIATKLGIENFTCSDGWLSRFKERHGLSFRLVCGESAAVDKEVCDEWQMGRLKELLAEFAPTDVYNVDEMGFFYKLLPKRTLSFKNERCCGGKLSKERVTVLVGANMNGSDKLQLLVVGKSKAPRCFKNFPSLPVEYEANSRAWMTQVIFEKWLRRLDRRMTSEKRNVLLIVDNCPAHGHVEGLVSIRLHFLPANTTSVLQPMDQGVIQNLKVFYRQNLLQRMLTCMESGKDYQVNLLSAIHMLASAWSSVKQATITNCFAHAGFGEALQPEAGSSTDADTSFLVGELSKKGVNVDFTAFQAVDSDLATSREDTIEAIIEEVQSDESDSDEEEAEAEEALVPKVSLQEAVEAASVLKDFFICEENGSQHLLSLARIESYLMNRRLQRSKQVKINQFFGMQVGMQASTSKEPTTEAITGEV